VYEKLGRHTDAEAELAKLKAENGDTEAYQYATIYAQWGITPKALDWLDTAMRVRDPGLRWLKTEPLMDPLRKEPRFEAIERELLSARAALQVTARADWVSARGQARYWGSS
jgi:hypothetical protein